MIIAGSQPIFGVQIIINITGDWVAKGPIASHKFKVIVVGHNDIVLKEEKYGGQKENVIIVFVQIWNPNDFTYSKATDNYCKLFDHQRITDIYICTIRYKNYIFIRDSVEWIILWCTKKENTANYLSISYIDIHII